MISFIEKKRPSLTYRIFSSFVAFTFLFTLLIPPTPSYAQAINFLPVPGTMINPSPSFTPAIVRGITIYPENPLEFDFIVDSADSGLKGEALKEESLKMVKYFLASLTVPERDLWVNLSPYEKGRIIPKGFGQTEMGRDLLAQDYLLKQLTASLMYPENELGKKFWDRVYTKANKEFGTTEIPVNTFNKVWIVPHKALVVEDGNTAYVAESYLKVMLEQDYLALMSNVDNKDRDMDRLGPKDVEAVSKVASQVVKDILIPEIEKEVNHGENFAQLRQIYNSMILAAWYKKNLKESLLAQVYANQNKTKGIDHSDKAANQKIYEQYLEAFKKGVYDYIKEDYDESTESMVARRYFSGGFDGEEIDNAMVSVPLNDVAQGRIPISPRAFSTLQKFYGNAAGAGKVTAHHIALFENTTPDVFSQAAVPPSAAEDFAMVAARTRSLPVDNLGKRLGLVPHRETEEDGIFNINRSIRVAITQGKFQDISSTEKNALREFIARDTIKSTIKPILASQGISVDYLTDLLRDESVKVIVLEDTKNDSPAIVMRSRNDYQVTHVGVRSKTIYMSRKLYDELNQERAQRDFLNKFFLRELISLASALKMYDSVKDNYQEAVTQAQALAEKAEEVLFGKQLDQVVGNRIKRFVKDYSQELAKKNVVFDWETSILDEATGKDLVGGKSFQAASYWANDPFNNLRSFSGTTTASVRFLESDPKVLPRIDDIVENLDTSDEYARQQAYQKIREIVLAVDVPDDIAKDLGDAYDKLVELTGQKLVAIRSSGKAEDISLNVPELEGVTLGANAGQHDTFLGELGRAAVVRRWKYDVASLFTDRVLDYRDGMMVYSAFGKILPDSELTKKIIAKLDQADSSKADKMVAKALRERDIKIISSLKLRDALRRHGFSEEVKMVERSRQKFMNVENIAMGVTIMPMAGVDISFVAFGHDLTTNWTAPHFQDIDEGEFKNKGRVVTITTNYGIGESIVQGVTTPDTYLVHIFEDEAGVHYNILDRQLGTKTIQAVYTAPVLERLRINEGVLAKYLSIMQTGELEGLEKGRVVKNFADFDLPFGEYSLGEVKKTLARLVSLRVDETIAGITDNDLKMFSNRYNKQQLKELIHLLKMADEIDIETRTMFTDVSKEQREMFSATDSQVIKIAKEFMKKAQGYGHLVDMEGAVGKNFGRDNIAVTVQRRPSNVDDGDVKNPRRIEISYSYVKEKDLKAVRDRKEEIVLKGTGQGVFAGEKLVEGIPTRNSFSGQIYTIKEGRSLVSQFEEIKSLADQGQKIIIRTRETTPDYVPILKYENVMGVIADVGGATSHAAVVSRELGIATVVGIQAWIDKLENEVGAEKAAQIIKYINTAGAIVTVDANAGEKTGFGVVYAGELPISQRNIQINIDRLPETYPKIGYIMGMPHPMLAMAKMAQYSGYSGVVLMRGEFAYAEENVNPRFGRAYDNKLIYDVLKTRTDNPPARKYFEALSDVEKQALNKFKLHLDSIKEARRNDPSIPMDRVEQIIESFRDKKSSDFLRSLNPYERADVEGIGKSPVAQKELAKLTRQLVGYLSYNQFFDSVHGGAVAKMAAANHREKNVVTYRSIDFKKNEARNLIGSIVYDPDPENATMIGERGARWLLQPENNVILREELKMLLRNVAKGYTNIGFMFPFVATPDELDQLLTILEEEEKAMSEQLSRELGRDFPVYLREVGQMIELPSNVVLADEFLKVLQRHERNIKNWFKDQYSVDINRKSFFSFGTNDLTQLTLGADRDNPDMGYLFDESHRFVIESIRHVVNAARKAGVKCGLCGQALVNLVKKNPEAAEDILMMLGSTGGYAGTDYLGTLLAVARAASATLKAGEVKRIQSDPIVYTPTGFAANLSKGAATRKLIEIQELRDLWSADVGDFVVLSPGLNAEKVEDALDDEEIRDKFATLGAVIYGAVEGFDQHRENNEKLKKLKVPVVRVMVKEASRLLRRLHDQNLNNGRGADDFITIDFRNKRIYGGKQTVEVAVPEAPSQIIVPTEDADVTELSLAGSVRSSDFYLHEVARHPLAYIGTGEETVLKEKLKGYILSRIKVVATGEDEKSRHIVYETMDLQSDDLVKLADHEKFLEEPEINPPLGFAGLDAMMKDRQWESLFRIEMSVLKGLIEEGYNISIQLNSVKDPQSVDKALQVIKEVGINNDTKVGMNTAWPGNYLFPDQFLNEGLSFITLDEARLAQAFLAADLFKNRRTMKYYAPDKIQSVMVKPRRMILAAAAKENVPVRILPYEQAEDEDNAMVAQLDPVAFGKAKVLPAKTVLLAANYTSKQGIRHSYTYDPQGDTTKVVSEILEEATGAFPQTDRVTRTTIPGNAIEEARKRLPLTVTAADFQSEGQRFELSLQADGRTRIQVFDLSKGERGGIIDKKWSSNPLIISQAIEFLDRETQSFQTGEDNAMVALASQERYREAKGVLEDIEYELARTTILAKRTKEQTQLIATPREVSLPKLIVISDYHGEIDLFLRYVADAISKDIGREVKLDHTKFPRVSIKKQLAAQDVDLGDLKLHFKLLGDFMDRGKYGIKCFHAAEELTGAGVADYVVGNHDEWAAAAAVGFHLPIYERYNFYGHAESKRLVEEHWNDSEIAKNRFAWWAARLKEYQDAQKEFQGEGILEVSLKLGLDEERPETEERAVGWIRDRLRALYKDFKDQLAERPEEDTLFQDLAGYAHGISVYTGFNEIGGMSIKWWKDRHEKVLKFKSKSLAVNQDLAANIWEEVSAYTEAALKMVSARLSRAKTRGEWWWQIFNDINNQNYDSPEWWVKDWLYHSGWGESVLKELNELEEREGVVWDETNYMRNPHIQAFAKFVKENYALFQTDKYGNLYTHGWLPINEETGEISITYKGKTYRGADFLKGLNAIQTDRRDPEKSLGELYEAFSLVNSWYADRTTRIKPEHLKRYIFKVGLEKIHDVNKIATWVTCHNPLNKLHPLGIGFLTQQGNARHVSVDKGMSYDKFKDLGGYTEISADGIRLFGFNSADFDGTAKIVEAPPTVVLKKVQEGGKIRRVIQKSWENKSLGRTAFLTAMKEQVAEELASLRARGFGEIEDNAMTAQVTDEQKKDFQAQYDATGAVKITDPAALEYLSTIKSLEPEDVENIFVTDLRRFESQSKRDTLQQVMAVITNLSRIENRGARRALNRIARDPVLAKFLNERAVFAVFGGLADGWEDLFMEATAEKGVKYRRNELADLASHNPRFYGLIRTALEVLRDKAQEEGSESLRSRVRNNLEALRELAETRRGVTMEGTGRTIETTDDNAMASTPGDEKIKHVGGIDLNPELLDLQIKRDEEGIPLPLPQQPIETMNIEGFLPVIINVTPVNSLPLIFGGNQPKEDPIKVGSRDYDQHAALHRELHPQS